MLTHIALLLLLTSASYGGPLSRLETAHPVASSEGYRLPNNIVPKHYTITLDPDFDTKTFTGTVEILMYVSETTNNIILHVSQINLMEANIVIKKVAAGSEEISIIATDYSGDDKHFFTITLQNNLDASYTYSIKIENYVGTLTNGNWGFYIANYTDAEGNERSFATTQFEPTSARLAFPCFDEPALKAIFKVFLRMPDNYIGISNMPEVATKKISPYRIEREFQETKEMSTYLIAFIISDMRLSNIHQRQRILARPQAIADNWHNYALETGEKVLLAMENLVNVSYSFSKIDQAAIPNKYFSVGAMENWGLVIYSETNLFYSETQTQISRKQSIATLIAHEYCHQWFGNLVSPAWWTYLWLNEGFARYLQYYAASIAEPEWDLMDQFVIKNLQYAFGPDSLNNTRPMNTDAGSTSDIVSLFDTIAYEKSGSVIRMMEMFLTTAVFRKGLNYYLNDREFKEATPTDLYRNLQRAVQETQPSPLPSDLTVEQIMSTWDSIAGYPVITVEREYNSNNPANVALVQTAFKLNDRNGEDGKWIVPVSYATKSNVDFTKTTPDIWLRETKHIITINNLKDDEWLLLNKQQVGYYRVNYDDTNWKLLIEALKNDPSVITRLNRAQLIDDAFNLARSRRLHYFYPLELMSYLVNETDYFPLYSFFTAITFVNDAIRNTPAQNGFQNDIINVLENVHKQLGYDEKSTDKHVEKLNRVNVLKTLCDLGHAECRKVAHEKFVAWKDGDLTTIGLNLQTPLLCGAMRSASQDEWNHLFGKYYEENSDVELKTRYFVSLGCSENADILNAYLLKLLDESVTLSGGDVFASIYNNGPVGIQTSLDFIEVHFEHLRERLGDVIIQTVIGGIGSKLTIQSQIDQLKSILKANEQHQQLFETGLRNAEESMSFSKYVLPQFSRYYVVSEDEPDGSIQVYSSILIITLSYFFCVYVK